MLYGRIKECIWDDLYWELRNIIKQNMAKFHNYKESTFKYDYIPANYIYLKWNYRVEKLLIRALKSYGIKVLKINYSQESDILVKNLELEIKTEGFLMKRAIAGAEAEYHKLMYEENLLQFRNNLDPKYSVRIYQDNTVVAEAIDISNNRLFTTIDIWHRKYMNLGKEIIIKIRYIPQLKKIEPNKLYEIRIYNMLGDSVLTLTNLSYKQLMSFKSRKVDKKFAGGLPLYDFYIANQIKEYPMKYNNIEFPKREN